MTAGSLSPQPSGSTSPEADRCAGVPVVCVPHAGAGASFFWPWRRLCPQLELIPVQLPGREERVEEEPLTRLAAAVDDVVGGLGEVLGRCGRIALFGHSLGAVLAYEVARRVEASGTARVARLFVSGSPGPLATRAQHATGLDDEAFLARVEQFAGFRHEAFEIPELRELILPVIRADVQLHESYAPLPGPPLRAPITCLRGADDSLVAAADAQGWHQASSAGCEMVEFPGGHMYLVDDPAAPLRVIRERLAQAVAR